jgi:protein-S-isoprenylcysteine O-methyltransferase Ste14
MKITNLLVVVAYISCMASFSWAMRRFFVKSTQPFNLEQRLIIYLGSLWALLQIGALLVAAPLQPAATALSLLLCFTALVIFWTAVRANRRRPLNWAFEPDKPSHLIVTGPYRWVRHPFYLSYMLCWVAPAVACAAPALLLPGAVMLILYWRASSREESNFLNSPIAPQYRSYQDQAGRFWPKRPLGAR